MNEDKRNLPIGTHVVMFDCLEADIHKGKTWKTRSIPWKLGSGDRIVLLEGYSGGFLTSKLKVVKQ